MPKPAKRSSSLKKHSEKALKKLIDRRVSSSEIVSVDLAVEMAALACDIGDTVSCLIDRQGRVKEYYVGGLRFIKDIKAQAAREKFQTLSQLRLITANPKQKEISDPELLLMKRYNLDLLLFIHATPHTTYAKSKGSSLEYADYAQLTHLSTGDQPWQIGEKNTVHKISQIDLQELLYTIEEDLASSELTVKVRDKETAVLVGFKSDDSFGELRGLADTAGAYIASEVKQNVRKPDSRFFVGSGKIQELALVVEHHSADMVIFDGELTPAQTRNIERELGQKVKVLDRTELILDIFAQRAQTREGKLQVELAQLKYLAPRLAGIYKSLSKLGGGIGTRGPGETQIEVDRRRIRDRIDYLQKQVNDIQKNRSNQRQQRKANAVPLVSLVGYTNAGKSTLFRTLTKADVLVEDKLFATLDPTIRRVNLPESEPFLLSDTVGFIQNLPTTLVDAFKATLEEIAESDLLLLVLDVSHPNRMEHLEVINDILEQIGVQGTSHLLVFNKSDRITEDEKEALQQHYPEAVFISAVERHNIEGLLDRILFQINRAC